MRYKKIMITIFIIIFVILCIFLFVNNKKESSDIIKEYLKTVSYIDEIKISLREIVPTGKDYGKNLENDIIWLDEDISKKVGIYYGIAKSKYKIHVIRLNVVDVNPPVFKIIKDITIYEGDNINLKENVEVTDDSGDEINIVVRGEYSLDKAGTYKLTYEASDKSNNIASADFNLIVKQKDKTKNTQTNISNDPNKSSKGYDIVYKDGAYYVKGILIANKTYALSKNYNPKNLTEETNNAYKKMKAAAKEDGIDLKIISGFRSYEMQKDLYNSYVRKDGKTNADRYSARPGHSEHQSGLAFDLISLKQTFADTKEGIWLNKNCYKYGFILRYPKGKDSITGYMYEPWHFRYIGSEAKKLYNNGNWITLEEYLGINSKYSK